MPVDNHSFLESIKNKFSDVIKEADQNEHKWFELFVDDGDDGTHTVDTGDTFDEAVKSYCDFVDDFGFDNVFLDIWTDLGYQCPEVILSFWDREDLC